MNVVSNNQNLERVSSFKILGVKFNQHMNWTDHVNMVTKSCFATLKSLKMFKNTANWNIRKTLSESLILSKLRYCCSLLSDAPQYEIKRLQKVQNAAAGFVLKRHANIADVIKLRWLPVEEYINLSLVKTAHDALHKDHWPDYLKLSLLQPTSRLLRSSQENTFDINTVNCVNGSFNHVAGKAFNDLPLNLKKIDSKNIFNKKCFNYFFDRAVARTLT